MSDGVFSQSYDKTQIACLFSCRKCGEPPYDQHYDENSFFNKKGFQEVLDNFKKEKNYYRDSLIVKHHKEKYMGKMPLWVIVDSLADLLRQGKYGVKDGLPLVLTLDAVFVLSYPCQRERSRWYQSVLRAIRR